MSLSIQTKMEGEKGAEGYPTPTGNNIEWEGVQLMTPLKRSAYWEATRSSWFEFSFHIFVF